MRSRGSRRAWSGTSPTDVNDFMRERRRLRLIAQQPIPIEQDHRGADKIGGKYLLSRRGMFTRFELLSVNQSHKYRTCHLIAVIVRVRFGEQFA